MINLFSNVLVGLVAQLVEQCPFKALVRGSSPRQPTTIIDYNSFPHKGLTKVPQNENIIILFFLAPALKFPIKSATQIKFWGVRGSLPTPGPGTVRYGGNTSCIEYRYGSDIIILDAGTGLRKLGQSLLTEFKKKPLNLTLLLSHTHWDHIHGLPFFAPIYESRCRLRVMGFDGSRKTLMGALATQMESTYFPVPLSKLPSSIEIEELKEQNKKLKIQFSIWSK